MTGAQIAINAILAALLAVGSYWWTMCRADGYVTDIYCACGQQCQRGVQVMGVADERRIAATLTLLCSHCRCKARSCSDQYRAREEADSSSQGSPQCGSEVPDARL